MKPTQLPNQNNLGFTLIELSIVVVIIGLIVAGVVGGQQLVHQAKIRSTIKDAEAINTAIRTFLGQYGTYPGDLSNAGSYWASSDCVNAVIPSDTPQNGRNSSNCNGNGNKNIDAHEELRIWQHLGATGADILDGSYLGHTSPVNRVTIGVTNPASSYPEGGWQAGAINSNPILRLAGNESSVDYLAKRIVTSRDAYAIDKRIDDGKRDSGKVKAVNSYCGSDSDYDIDDESSKCRMDFYL